MSVDTIKSGLSTAGQGVADVWKDKAARVQEKGFLQSGADAGKNALHWMGKNKLLTAGIAVGTVAAVSVMRHRHQNRVAQQQMQQGPGLER